MRRISQTHPSYAPRCIDQAQTIRPPLQCNMQNMTTQTHTHTHSSNKEGTAPSGSDFPASSHSMWVSCKTKNMYSGVWLQTTCATADSQNILNFASRDKDPRTQAASTTNRRPANNSNGVVLKPQLIRSPNLSDAIDSLQLLSRLKPAPGKGNAQRAEKRGTQMDVQIWPIGNSDMRKTNAVSVLERIPFMHDANGWMAFT